MFRIQQIDHVELHVPDRYEAARWYETVFGLEIVPEFEDWAAVEGGPLMLTSSSGATKLALFEGIPPGFDEYAGFYRVAFRVNGDGFMTFLARLDTLHLLNKKREPLSRRDVVDHEKSWSIYFFDPYGYRFEIITYDYEKVKTALETAQA